MNRLKQHGDRIFNLEEAYEIFSLEASRSWNFEDKPPGWIGVNAFIEYSLEWLYIECWNEF